MVDQGFYIWQISPIDKYFKKQRSNMLPAYTT